MREAGVEALMTVSRDGRVLKYRTDRDVARGRATPDTPS
jgi:hypothetical protein